MDGERTNGKVLCGSSMCGILGRYRSMQVFVAVAGKRGARLNQEGCPEIQNNLPGLAKCVHGRTGPIVESFLDGLKREGILGGGRSRSEDVIDRRVLVLFCPGRACGRCLWCDGWMDGWMDGWLAGWLVGEQASSRARARGPTERQADRQTERERHTHTRTNLCVRMDVCTYEELMMLFWCKRRLGGELKKQTDRWKRRGLSNYLRSTQIPLLCRKKQCGFVIAW